MVRHHEDVAEPSPRREIGHHSGERDLSTVAVVCTDHQIAVVDGLITRRSFSPFRPIRVFREVAMDEFEIESAPIGADEIGPVRSF